MPTYFYTQVAVAFFVMAVGQFSNVYFWKASTTDASGAPSVRKAAFQMTTEDVYAWVRVAVGGSAIT